ncbi:hypothetical protein [Chamaesiphon sp. OTE_20_metabat_361]|nr:hypothetical protein [Chamaesiphon sp. OTE_20_metabat_361]
MLSAETTTGGAGGGSALTRTAVGTIASAAISPQFRNLRTI